MPSKLSSLLQGFLRGLLFPASIKNYTEQIFVISRGLNDVKKSLINSKIYRLLRIIDLLKKINHWEEVKGQSNKKKTKKTKNNLYGLMQRLKNKKKLNNSRHLCFTFTTLRLNNLLNFNINSIDDHNKQITFEEDKKK